MTKDFQIGFECVPSSMLLTIQTNADAFWIHVGSEAAVAKLPALIERFTFGTNLRMVFVTGRESEMVHDLFDDTFFNAAFLKNEILTAWSEDSFSEALWEFVHVHCSEPNVKLAKGLIISDLFAEFVDQLTQIAALDLEVT